MKRRSSSRLAKKAAEKPEEKESPESQEEEEESPVPKKRKPVRKSSTKSVISTTQSNDPSDEETTPKTKKATKPRKKKKEPVTIRDPVPLPEPTPENCLKIVSWNVDGLRSKGRKDALIKLAQSENAPDIIFLQETKLQTSHTTSFAGVLSDIGPGYDDWWTCSGPPGKLGYSGCAAFTKRHSKNSPPKTQNKQQQTLTNALKKKKKQQQEEQATDNNNNENDFVVGGGGGVVRVWFGIGNEAEIAFGDDGGLVWKECCLDEKVDVDCEGRSISLEYPHFVLVGLYVPNSGQKLERLKYRTEEWDRQLQEYVSKVEEKTGKPTIVCGDLNVAHQDLDIYNYFAPHMKKTAGCTPKEKESFGRWLTSKNMVDAMRYFYPNSRGQYTYWSSRFNLRPQNRGLRLDYFVCSKALFEGAPPPVKVEPVGDDGGEQDAAATAATTVTTTGTTTATTAATTSESTTGVVDDAVVKKVATEVVGQVMQACGLDRNNNNNNNNNNNSAKEPTEENEMDEGEDNNNNNNSNNSNRNKVVKRMYVQAFYAMNEFEPGQSDHCPIVLLLAPQHE